MIPTNDPLAFPLGEVAIEVTVHCNLSCAMCSVWQGKRHGPESKVVRSVLGQARELGARTFVPCGGEPFMRPDFVDLLEHAQSLGYERSEVVTNGVLVPRYLDRLEPIHTAALHVSIDGPQNIHDTLRGEGVYEKALEAARGALSRGIRVGISGVLMKPTYGHSEHVLELAAELGLEEVSFQPFQPEIHGMDRDMADYAFAPSERKKVEDWIASLRQRAKELGVRIYTDAVLDHVPAYFFDGLRPIPEQGCFLPSRFILVNIDGELYPCFFMRDESMGNVCRGDKLSEIWHGELHGALQMLAITKRCPGCLAACSDIATFEGTP